MFKPLTTEDPDDDEVKLEKGDGGVVTGELSIYSVLDTPCTAGARSTGRLSIFYPFG